MASAPYWCCCDGGGGGNNCDCETGCILPGTQFADNDHEISLNAVILDRGSHPRICCRPPISPLGDDQWCPKTDLTDLGLGALSFVRTLWGGNCQRRQAFERVEHAPYEGESCEGTPAGDASASMEARAVAEVFAATTRYGDTGAWQVSDFSDAQNGNIYSAYLVEWGSPVVRNPSVRIEHSKTFFGTGPSGELSGGKCTLVMHKELDSSTARFMFTVAGNAALDGRGFGSPDCNLQCYDGPFCDDWPLCVRPIAATPTVGQIAGSCLTGNASASGSLIFHPIVACFNETCEELTWRFDWSLAVSNMGTASCSGLTGGGSRILRPYSTMGRLGRIRRDLIARGRTARVGAEDFL